MTRDEEAIKTFVYGSVSTLENTIKQFMVECSEEEAHHVMDRLAELYLVAEGITEDKYGGTNEDE